MRRLVTMTVVLGVMAMLASSLGRPVEARAATAPAMTFAQLSADFAAGGTVVLGADITQTGEALVVGSGSSVTLDLAGHHLSVTAVPVGEAAIGVRDGSELTVEADGGGSLVVAGGIGGAGIGGDAGAAGVIGTTGIPGIGAGAGGAGGTGATGEGSGAVQILGGIVRATGGRGAAAIGGGAGGDGGRGGVGASGVDSIDGTGGTGGVGGTGGPGGAAGAGGSGGDAGAITIIGGSVTVEGGAGALDVGGGSGGAGGTGGVGGSGGAGADGTATQPAGGNGGTGGAAGVGGHGGEGGAGGTVIVSGALVTAAGGGVAEVGGGSGGDAGIGGAGGAGGKGGDASMSGTGGAGGSGGSARGAMAADSVPVPGDGSGGSGGDAGAAGQAGSSGLSFEGRPGGFGGSGGAGGEGGTGGDAGPTGTLLLGPGAPTSVSASAGDASASVSFNPPAESGSSPVTGYTVIATDVTDAGGGGQTATSTGGPIVVGGLRNGDAYTFTVEATSAVGNGFPSDPSSPVTPSAPATVLAPASSPSTSTGTSSGPASPEHGGGSESLPNRVDLIYTPNHAHRPAPDGDPRYSFRFTDPTGEATFECSLDGSRFRPCSSPLVLRHLSRGRHVLRVRAVSPDGAISPVRTVRFQAGRRA